MDTPTHDDPVTEESKGPIEATFPHDSMVTVRLSGPPSLTLITQPLVMDSVQGLPSTLETPIETPDAELDDSPNTEFTTPLQNLTLTKAEDENPNALPNVIEEPLQYGNSRRGSHSTEGSGDGEVNWAQLEKTEEQEPRNQDSDDVGCACLVLPN
jgi:hypothetical protein